MPAPRNPKTEECRRLFVEVPLGKPAISVEEAARRVGMPYITAANASARDGWVKQRAQFIKDRERARQIAVITEQAEIIAEFDDQTIRVARAALGRLAQFLTDEQGPPSVDRNGNAIPRPALKTADLVNIATAMATLQSVIRNAMGSDAEAEGSTFNAKGNNALDWEEVVRQSKQVVATIIEQRTAAISHGK